MSTEKIDQIIEILIDQTDFNRDEIQEKIQEQIKLTGDMINEEGAAYIVANNLGVVIDLDKSTQSFTTDELLPNQTNITILGRVSKIYQTRTFSRDDGSTGKVRNIQLKDNAGEVRVALWDDRADMIEEKDINIGDIVKISGAVAKMGYRDKSKVELSIGSHGLIDKTNEGDESDFPEVERAPLVSIDKLASLDEGSEVTIKGKIVDQQGVNSFSRDDDSTGKVTSLTLTDTSKQTVRVTFWDKEVEKALSFDIGDTIAIHDVRLGSSNYGKDLTFRPYSRIEKIDDEELEEIEVDIGGKLEKLSELQEGMKGITVIGKIINKTEINSFEKNGELIHVGNATISDNTQAVRVSFWREKTEELEQLSVGDIIKISNATSRFSDFSGQVELSINSNTVVDNITDDVNPEEFERDPEFINISEVSEVRQGVSIKLKLIRKYGTREITLKDGSSASVLNADVLDMEGNRGRIAAWDDNISKVDKFEEDTVIVLTNVRIKPSEGDFPPEILVNNYTEIEETDEEPTILQSASDFQSNPAMYQKGKLTNIRENMNIEVSGTIVNVYPPVFYTSCSKCPRKVQTEEGVTDVGICPVHEEVETRPRMILSMQLDDYTDVIKIKLFDSEAEKFLGMDASEAKDMVERLSDDKAPVKEIEMKDVNIKGKVEEEEYNNETNLVISVREIEFVDHASEFDNFLNKFD